MKLSIIIKLNYGGKKRKSQKNCCNIADIMIITNFED